MKNPELHRYVVGGTFGGPIIKDKLFGFVAYQHLHVSDQEIGDGFLNVPVGLSERTAPAAVCAAIVNNTVRYESDCQQHRYTRRWRCSTLPRFRANPASG